MTRFIAEIGSNHNGDLGRALALIDACAEAGCDAVKLQIFRVEDLFSPEALAAHPQLAARKAWEFPLDALGPIRKRCDALGIQLGATPFALWAVDAVADHVDFLKVASYELLWHDLLRACATSGKPLIVSTGMASLDEIDGAVEAIRDAGGSDLTLLHCVSAYPTPADQANLAAIETLRSRYGCPVGWSDHSCRRDVVARAVGRWGAVDVEVHVDLDGEGNEAGEHNWAPSALGDLIAELEAGAGTIAEASILDGDGVKRAMPVEEPDVPWRADPVDGLRPLRGIRAALAAS